MQVEFHLNENAMFHTFRVLITGYTPRTDLKRTSRESGTKPSFLFLPVLARIL